MRRIVTLDKYLFNLLVGSMKKFPYRLLDRTKYFQIKINSLEQLTIRNQAKCKFNTFKRSSMSMLVENGHLKERKYTVTKSKG
ncbi:hypothetical protein VAE055_110001 [Vibrio aestuarianus]|nr:hypothetical protein VAE055_110001 [Vibrio aestuarianus]CAH8235811.1 hypothetical protein VAE128_620001 [Vibrio aestuarianus]